MVGTESHRTMLYNGRTMSEPSSMLKSNSQYQMTSQNGGNKNKQNKACMQTTRRRDAIGSYYQHTKFNACYKQYRSQTLLYTRSCPRDTGSQTTWDENLTLLQKNSKKQSASNLNNGALLYTSKSNSDISLRGRCFSAPPTRGFYRTSEQHYAKYMPKGDLTNRSKATRTKHRSMSAPKTSNGLRNSLSVCNTFTKSNLTNQQTVCSKSAEKFSSSLLSKTNDLDKESMSDVISFSDDVIEQQLDAYSTSDDSSVVDFKWRPQSCISFRRTVEFAPNSKHHCVTYLKNRPRSSPNPVRLLKSSNWAWCWDYNC